jgi:hypothetical protein
LIYLIVASYKHLYVIEEVINVPPKQSRAVLTEDFVSDVVPQGQSAYILIQAKIIKPIETLSLELINLKVEAQINEKFPVYR